MRDKPDWTFPLRKADETFTSRLLVFPYAAAGPTSLRPLITRLPGSVEVLGVALPGRERRFGEPPTAVVTDILTGVTDDLAAREELPTYLLGHSMGASLALALALSMSGACSGLIISGRKPHDVALGPLQGMGDEEIISFLGAVGNTAPQLLGDAYWRNHLIQLFRRDIELDIQASHLIESGILRERIIALGGSDDPYVSSRELESWAACTSGTCDVVVFPGDHFFLLDPANRPHIESVLADFICGLSEPLSH